MKTHPAILILASLAFALAVFDATPESSLAAPAPKRKPKPDPEAEALAADLTRFPSAEVCKHWIDFGSEHLKWIDGRIVLFPADRAMWEEYRMEIEGRLRAWRVLSSVRCGWYGLSYAYEQLDELRAIIGNWNYLTGFLPAPVDTRMLLCID